MRAFLSLAGSLRTCRQNGYTDEGAGEVTFVMVMVDVTMAIPLPSTSLPNPAALYISRMLLPLLLLLLLSHVPGGLGRTSRRSNLYALAMTRA
jgi:hypothetical protein